MTANERIKEVRQALNKSQREFAQAIYVSHGYLSEVETGHKEVKERLIHYVSSAFSVNKEWLLTGKGRMFNTTPEKKLEQMTKLFNELKPAYQDFILRQIDELIELQKIGQ